MISYFIASNSGFMDPHINHIVPVLNSLLLEEDVNIQYNASGAIFNVMTMSGILF